MTIQIKVTVPFFPVMPLIIMYRVVLTFGCVYEILKYSLLEVSYLVANSCGPDYNAVQGVTHSESVNLYLHRHHSRRKVFERYRVDTLFIFKLISRLNVTHCTLIQL